MLLRIALSVNRVASIYHSLPGALLVFQYVSTGLAGDVRVPPGHKGLAHALPVLVLSLLLPVGRLAPTPICLCSQAGHVGVDGWIPLREGGLRAGQATDAPPRSCGLFPV